MNEKEKSYSTAYGEVHYWLHFAEVHKPWLVFLPGLTADHRLFDRQIETLSKTYNCFTWDAPAHGCSRPFSLKFTLEDMAVYLHEIFEEEGIERPVLIGQSLGGYISQMYMSLYPDSVAGFVSIDSCSLMRKYYTKVELVLLKHTKWMYLSIPWQLLIRWGSNGNAKTPYGRALMKEMMESYEKVEYCALAHHGFKIFAAAVEEERNYALDCPVLLICGEKDQAGSAKSYNCRWQEQDGYIVHWIANAGHNSNTDAAEEVNRLIDHFVSSLGKIK